MNLEIRIKFVVITNILLFQIVEIIVVKYLIIMETLLNQLNVVIHVELQFIII